MSTIPIIQGSAISDVYQKQQTDHYQTNNDERAVHATLVSDEERRSRREDTPKKFQDVFWAIAFIAHLIVMIVLIVNGLRSQNGIETNTYGPIVSVAGITGTFGIGASLCAFPFMMTNAIGLVKAALIFSLCTSLAMGIIGFMTGNILLGVLGLLSFAFGICYAKIVWVRIPFAAANLRTALTAVRSNLGVAVLALGFTALAFVWTILWFLGVGNALSSGNSAVIFLLFFSYYWVHEVLQNTMHVTTAGIIGTWWFVPEEANSCCSAAVTDSFCRATTYSFGSVCFGSLLVAVVQALRALEHYSRDNDDFQLLSCIIQCILGCIEGILESVNRWAYVYVGLYGFNYIEAGRNVVQFFQHKGWTAIISDDLASNVLFMMSVAVGLASGLVGLVVSLADSNMFYNLGFENSMEPAFMIGFLSGFLFASVILSVVGSGVNTVIVCYAEDPAAFQLNHPQLSTDMREAWVKAWPDLMH